MARRRKKLPVEECIHRLKKWYSTHRSWVDKTISAYQVTEGQQWREEEELALREAGRPVITFNFVGAFVRGVTGAESVNRLAASFVPVGVEDAADIELLNLAKTYLDNREGSQNEIAHAFRDLIISGVGAGEHFVYEDMAGRRIIGFERRDPLLLAWDPGSQKRGLQDAWWIAAWRRVHRDDVAARWPRSKKWLNEEFEDEVTSQKDLNFLKTRTPYIRNIGEGYDKRAGVYPFDPRPSDDYITIVQFQYRHLKPGGKSEPEEDESMVELSAAIPDLEAFLSGVTEEEETPEKGRPQYSVRQKLFVGTREIEDEELAENEFTIKAMTGPQKVDGQFQGFVQDLISPQDWANKAYSLIIDIVASQAKGGLFAEANVFEDPRKAEQDYSNPRKIIHLLPGGLERVRERQPAAFPEAVFKIVQTAKESIREIAGVSLEFLGQQENFQPGVVEDLRRSSTIVLLNDYFNALRDFRFRTTRLLGKMIIRYMNDGRLMRLSSDLERPYLNMSLREEDLEFDVLVDEAPSSPDTKGKTWAMLQSIIPQLAQFGISPPIEMIDFIPLPTSLRESLKKSIQQQMQAAQQGGGDQQQEIEKLTAATVQVELQKGQLDVEEKKIALQMKQLEIQAKQMEMAGEAQELEFKRNQMLLEAQSKLASIEAERETLLLEREKISQEIQMEREKLSQQLIIEQERAKSEMELAKMELMKQATEIESQRTKAACEMEDRKHRNRKISLKKDARGRILGATVMESGIDGEREFNIDIVP